jgi:hypothetical protein
MYTLFLSARKNLLFFFKKTKKQNQKQIFKIMSLPFAILAESNEIEGALTLRY